MLRYTLLRNRNHPSGSGTVKRNGEISKAQDLISPFDL